MSEQNNFAVSEFILNKRAESNFEAVKNKVQHDQIDMAVYFRHRVKVTFSSVVYLTSVHWTSHFIQGKRNTQPCITGHPIQQAQGGRV